MRFVHVGGNAAAGDGWEQIPPNQLPVMFDEGKQLFVLVYMNGCGPCEQTKPQWDAIRDRMGDMPTYMADDSLAVVKLNQEQLPEVGDLVGQVDGFPTIRRVARGKQPAEFEDQRTTDDFIAWIKQLSAVARGQAGGRRRRRRTKRHRKRHRSRKMRR